MERRREGNILTFIFVVAIATLGVMNGNIQAVDEQKAEAALTEAVASAIEHPKSEKGTE